MVEPGDDDEPTVWVDDETDPVEPSVTLPGYRGTFDEIVPAPVTDPRETPTRAERTGATEPIEAPLARPLVEAPEPWQSFIEAPLASEAETERIPISEAPPAPPRRSWAPNLVRVTAGSSLAGLVAVVLISLAVAGMLGVALIW